jgi:mitochondrial ATPase complex subunit ATP10
MIRNFSSPDPSSTEKKEETVSKFASFEDANPERIKGIQVNPDSVGSTVLPGNYVYKKFRLSGNTRKVPVELEHGYFWMMWDLEKTGKKPTISNETLISEKDAESFPVLTGLHTLNKERVDLPFYFVEQADEKDVRCTLVAISFREYGHKLLSSWVKPFKQAFEGNPAVNVLNVQITERWTMKPLSGLLSSIIRGNTPAEEYDNTLLYFGTDVDEFRDVLRMHNIMTSYVFLVDDLGHIRFAGSGEASEQEVERVVRFAKQLIPSAKTSKQPSRTRGIGGAKKKRTRRR